jgi:4,5-dihydroxyphthalate decarboxylase
VSNPVALPALLGDYPVTRALRRGELTSPVVQLQFADVPSPASAFPRAVRGLEFDVAELAIVTFLLAKAHGKPLVLLPAVVLGRLQHPYLVYNRERGPLAPGDLTGRRVGLRSYSVTTATWVRGILAEDWGVDLDRITWVTFEEPHVAEFRDPPGVQRAPDVLDTTPFGLEANRRNLEVAIDYAFRQRLIPRRFTVDELFDDVTRRLGAT